VAGGLVIVLVAFLKGTPAADSLAPVAEASLTPAEAAVVTAPSTEQGSGRNDAPLEAVVGTTEAQAIVPTTEAQVQDVSAGFVHVDPIIVGDLRELVRLSPMIVIGEVAGIGEVINTARDLNDSSRPSTTVVGLSQVYRVTVERYLKGGGPAALNVVQAEGFLADPRERPVELPTSSAAINQAKARYPHVPLRPGTRYLFFVHALDGFDPMLNYVTTAAGNPWIFALPIGGTARPHGPFREVDDRFPARTVASLVGEVEGEIRAGRSSVGR
jgi:hypothetical protein